MLTYFLQVNVCWLLFYGAYFVLLSRETFFRLNRIWLIISLLGGLILPLIAPAFEVVEPTNVAAVMLEPFVISASNFSQNVQNTEGSFLRILAAIYGLGVAVSLGKLIIGFWKIKRLAHRAERLPIEDFTLMQVQETIAPFSFFRWVFVNLNLIQSADLQEIILHEQAHVRERHSFDVVFAEVLGVVFWWSPLVYFYTKSLKNVHEYAADAAVLRTSTPPQYGRLLLRQQQSGMSLSLANPFFSQLKKRILMMTRNKSKRRALAKYALALPIFLILTVLLASPKTKVMATTEVLSDNVVSTIETFEKTHFDNTFNDNSAQETVQNGIIVQLETGQKSGIISPDALKLNKKIVVYQVIDGKRFEAEIISLSILRTNDHNRGVGMNGWFKFIPQNVFDDVFTKAEEGDRLKVEEIKIKDVRTGSEIFAGSMEFLVSSSSSAVFVETPYATLSNGKRGGSLTIDEIKAVKNLVCQQNVNGVLENKKIKGFTIFRTPEVGNTERLVNEGATFSKEVQQMINAAKLGDRFHFGSIKLVKKGDESDHIRDLRFDIPPVFMPFKDDKPSVAPEDGILVTLEDANGNTLVLPTKTLRLKSLPTQYDRIKVVQTVDGVQKTLDVEGFVFFRIPRKQDPVQANNVGNKFNNELNRIFATLELTDWCQIMDIRTIGNGPKILSRSFYLEDTPQYKPLFEQKQSDLVKKDSIEPVYSTVEQNPTFVGGMDSLFRFLGRNIQYPAEARQLKAEGTVYVGFIVEKDGSITNVKTKRNLPESVIDTVKIISVEGGLTGSKIVKRQDHSCEKEAIRVISSMPKWNPGKTNGVPVRAAFTLPIKFRLD